MGQRSLYSCQTTYITETPDMHLLWLTLNQDKKTHHDFLALYVQVTVKDQLVRDWMKCKTKVNWYRVNGNILIYKDLSKTLALTYEDARVNKQTAKP